MASTLASGAFAWRWGVMSGPTWSGCDYRQLDAASKWTGTGVPRNAGFLPMILPINRSLVGARVERFSSARRRRGARFEKQSKKIKWCKVDGHVVDPIGTNRTLGPL
jgi:hypothetical protein